MWQKLGSGKGAAGVSSVSRAQQLPHVRSKPAPAVSKMELARAEPESEIVCVSGRTYVRKKIQLQNSSWEQEE